MNTNPPRSLTQTPPHRCRGITAITAIVLIGFVGITLASLTTLFATQAKRTRTVQIHAQLRQLLEIGAQSSVYSLNQPSAKVPATVSLPPSLAGATLTITSKSSTATTQTLLISATLKDLSHSQTLTLDKQNNRWQITGALLN